VGSLSVRASCWFVALGCAFGLSTASAVTLEVKAFEGMPAPGAPPGLFMTFYSHPVVNVFGEVAFLGSVADADPETFDGAPALFAPDESGALTTVVLEPAPGLPPETQLAQIGPYFARLDDSGAVAFSAQLYGPGVDWTNDTAIFRWHAQSGLEVAVQKGDPVSGSGAGDVFGSINGGLTHPTIGPDGAIGFNAFFGPAELPYDHLGNFVADENGVSMIAATGTPVPGIAGAVLTDVYDAVGNGLGQSLFEAYFDGPGVIPEQNDEALFLWDPDAGLSMLVRRGDPAPLLPEGVVMTNPSASLGDGAIAYGAWLAGPGVDESNDSVLYAKDSSGAFVLLAREGGPAPGTGPGTTFSNFSGYATLINAAGQVVFASELIGPGITPTNNYGFWVYDPATGAVALRARMGDPAPELPGLVISALWGPLLNDRGDLVFEAMVAGPGVDEANDEAIFAFEGGVHPVKVMREGDLASFGAGDLRPLRGPSLLGGAITGVPGIGQLSDNGHVAFYAMEGAEWKGAIVVATLPEPRVSTSLMLGVVAIVCLRRWRDPPSAPPALRGPGSSEPDPCRRAGERSDPAIH